VDYATDDSKTATGEFITGVNCNPESAHEEFIEVKKHYGKEDKIIAYHAYQSFKPGEVSPEVVHEIGVEFAKRAWNDYQVVIATHLNTHSLHNHFVVNSVSHVHGKKLRAKWWVDLKKYRMKFAENTKYL
jgi:hypothetical protein